MNNTEAPSQLDLHPEPEVGGMLNKRRITLVLGAAALLIGGSILYGGYRRNQNQITRAAQDEANKAQGPASASEITKEIPAGNAALVNPKPPTPDPQPVPLPPEPQVYVQQPPIQREPPAQPQEPKVDPEEQRLRAAMLAPTAAPRTEQQQTAFTRQPATEMPRDAAPQHQDGRVTTEEVAAQQRRIIFSQGTQQQRSTYLSSTRTPQIGPYEIKAGWEIPAVLEQELNSDLPGEMKALVTQNVYDTATGNYLLIPQGSRLLGKYNSEVGYGQEGVQAIWERIIYPDGSSIDLEAMNGLDSHGNAGFRDKVDRHYKRTFGMALLTSAFAVAFELSQRRTYGSGSYAYPSAGDTAAAAVGREISQAGSEMFRKNMAVAPTIKIRVGYEFRVRVNRDMLFSEPYQAISNEVHQPQPKSQRAGR